LCALIVVPITVELKVPQHAINGPVLILTRYSNVYWAINANNC